MTLILAAKLENKNGSYIILGADGKGTLRYGGTTMKTKNEEKMFLFNDFVSVLISGDGEIGCELILRFKEKYSSLLKKNVSIIAEKFSEFCRTEYKKFGLYTPATAETFPSVSFIIAGLEKISRGKFSPKIFILRSESSFINCRKPKYCVDGAPIIAEYLMIKGYSDELQIDEACKLIGQILYETSQVDSTVGGKLKIAFIDRDGFNYDDESIKSIVPWDVEELLKAIKD